MNKRLKRISQISQLPTPEEQALAIARSRRGRGSKIKGASFERTVKDIIQKAWGISLTRTPLSGGFNKSKEDSKFHGDLNLTTETQSLLLHIECKNHKTWSIKEWWRQTIGDCPKDKIPVLIMHKAQEIKEGKRVENAEDFILLKLDDFLKLADTTKIIGESK